MLILGHQIDDFKTERKELLPPLATAFRVVPILFYGSLVFLVVVGSLATWHARLASARYQEILQQAESIKAEIASAKSARASLESKIREATNLEQWVLASMPMQPLVVEIIRSMGPSASIVELTLERDPVSPSQLKLTMVINTDSDKQIEETLSAIRRMNYREFSPTQTMVKGNLDYRASLLWRKPDDQLISPENRGKEVLVP